MNQRKYLLASALVMTAWWAALGIAPAAAQPNYPPPPGASHGYYRPAPGDRPYECEAYARDNADRYMPPGAGIGRGAARGAVRGAIFGAIVGGKKGARRGAMAGGGLGAVAAGARARRQREHVRQLAYDDCMLGFRR